MYNTENAVPSAALADMADNAQVFDALVTQTEGTVTDRLGVPRRVFQQIIMDMGFQPLEGSFQTGATITARNQTLYDDVSQVFYSWGGSLPKIVPAGSTPATVGGVGVGAWVDRKQETIRSELLAFGATINDIAISSNKKITFDTLDEVLANSYLYTGLSVQVKGRSVVGDGGDNDYAIVAGGTGVVDGGSYIDLPFVGLQLKALNSNGIYKPEQWGVSHSGVTAINSLWQKFISAVPAGAVIELFPSGVYHNNQERNSSSDDKIDFSVDDITIIANNAKFTRAATVTANFESAVVEFSGDRITVHGILNIDGMEPIGVLKNTDVNRTDIGTNVYALTQGIRLGIKVVNCRGFTSTARICTKNTVFGAYFKNATDFECKIKSDYSGQVVPNIVTGGDPALGAGAKLSGCTDFDIDVTGTNNANALIEVEPVSGDTTNARGRVTGRGQITAASALTIGNSTDITFDVQCNSDQYFNSAGLLRLINGARRCVGSCISNATEKTLLFMYNVGSSDSSDNRVEVGSAAVSSRPVYIQNAGTGATYRNDITLKGGNTTSSSDSITLINTYSNTIRGNAKRESSGGTCVVVSGAVSVNNRLVELDIENQATDFFVASGEIPIFINCMKGSTRRTFCRMPDYQINATQIKLGSIPASSGSASGSGYIYNNTGDLMIVP